MYEKVELLVDELKLVGLADVVLNAQVI